MNYSFLIWLFVLNFYISFSLAERNFYATLKISKTATTTEVKKAYRKLAKELHPDKNKDDPEASKKFQDLGAAYEVLSDPEKRKTYDRCGEECLKKEGMMDSSDPFANFFSDFGFQFGGNNGGHNDHNQVAKGANIVMNIYVTLEELYTGHFIEIVHNKPVLKPATGTRKCNCRQEMVTRKLGAGRFQMMQETVCSECPNVKLVNEERLVDIEIEPGMITGQQISFIAEGEPHLDGEPGDLLIVVNQITHSRFERKGDDLYTNVTISLQDALIGFEIEIDHLDGHKVILKRDKITWPGARIKKKGEGMPNFDNNNLQGTMYITFDIEFPKKNLLDHEKDDIRKLLEQATISKIYNGLAGVL